jgi:hypothetical protein
LDRDRDTLKRGAFGVPHPESGDIVRGDSGDPVGTPADRMLVWVEGDFIEYYLPEREYGRSATVAFTLRDGAPVPHVDPRSPQQMDWSSS